MTLLWPLGLAWLGAALALLGLYLFKPRRFRVEVSSLWLWEGRGQAERVRSLWQWLRRHLLLILQVLIALLGALALARPAIAALVPRSGQTVLLVDASASMLARDGMPTRLDHARARAMQLLARLPANQRVSVVQLTDHAEVLLPPSRDRGAAQEALRRLWGTTTTTNVAEGLAVAAALFRDPPHGDIYFFTDGAFGAGNLRLPPGVSVHLIPAGQGGADNQAVTQLAARRDGQGEVEAFVRVRNYATQPVGQVLNVRADGELLEGQAIQLGAGAAREFLLRGFPADTQLIEVWLEPRDLLTADNIRAASVDPAQPLRRLALVNVRSEYLERVLQSLPQLEVTLLEADEYDPASVYDLYVFDGWMPPVPPPGHWLLVDPPPNQEIVPVIGALGAGGRLPAQTGAPAAPSLQAPSIAYTQPSSLLRYVDLSGVQIYVARHLAQPPWAEVVVGSREGPLILAGYPEGQRAVVFAFDLNPMTTNLVNRSVFPVLMANVLDWLSGIAGAKTSDIAAGEALPIDPLPRATLVRIVTPSGRTYKFAGHERFRFVDTMAPGAYVVTQFAGDALIARETFIVGRLPPAESDLRPRPEVARLAASTPPIAAGVTAPERIVREWWRWLAVGMLGLLLVEWWWFHRA